MKNSFINFAVSGLSKLSCAITWHQWQAEWPTERRIGLFNLRASSSASSDQGYQSTGLSACWRKYGEGSVARRFIGRSLTVHPDSKLAEEGQLEATVPQDVPFRNRSQQAPVTIDDRQFFERGVAEPRRQL